MHFKKIINYLTTILIVSLFAYIPTVSADSLDTKGNSFWLTFTKNFEGGKTQFSFFISSDELAQVTIEAKGIDFSQTISIQPGIATKIDLPIGVETLLYNSVSLNGIKITSDVEITIYGLSRQQYTTDAYLGLPNNVIGTDYIVLAYSSTEGGSSQYAVIATEDNTQVSITASPNDPCGIDTEITLNAGEVYQHKSCNIGDVTGTEIKSTFPIGVFAGHECANVPSNTYKACDHLLEQIPPTSSWGQKILTAPLAKRKNGDTFRVITSSDNTTVTLNGSVIATLNKGEHIQTTIEGPGNITADAPILVAQFSNGSTYDNVTSDPFMMLIPPFEQFLDNYTFATPTEGFESNFVNIVVKNSNISALKLDDQTLDEASFIAIPGSEFSYNHVSVEPGSHTLTGAVAGIFVYGYDSYDSYGYPGGLSLSEIAEVDTVALEPDYKLVAGDACFEAKVSDILSNGIPDIRVDFIVDLLEGSERTDSNGTAVFCVAAGDNPGEFNVTASVGNKTVEGKVFEEPAPSSPAAPSQASGGGGGGSPSLPLAAILALMILIRRLPTSKNT